MFLIVLEQVKVLCTCIMRLYKVMVITVPKLRSSCKMLQLYLNYSKLLNLSVLCTVLIVLVMIVLEQSNSLCKVLWMALLHNRNLHLCKTQRRQHSLNLTMQYRRLCYQAKVLEQVVATLECLLADLIHLILMRVKRSIRNTLLRMEDSLQKDLDSIRVMILR